MFNTRILHFENQGTIIKRHEHINGLHVVETLTADCGHILLPEEFLMSMEGPEIDKEAYSPFQKGMNQFRALIFDHYNQPLQEPTEIDCL